MAGSLNKVSLIGNLGQDPEVRHLENGASVANFSIATTESFTDKNTGQRRDITDWHNIVVWRGLAKVVEQYVKKGHKVYVEGKLKTRQWQDKENNTRYTTEVVVDNLIMLNSPQKSQGGEKAPYPTEEPPRSTPVEAIKPEPEDDLPF